MPERPCPDCGLNTQGSARGAIAGMTSRNARQWQEVPARPGDLARRPSPGTWPALEYACHVRDVLWLYDERLVLMLTTGGPHYPNWDTDAPAVARRYAEQDPAQVADPLRRPPPWASLHLASRARTASPSTHTMRQAVCSLHPPAAHSSRS